MVPGSLELSLPPDWERLGALNQESLQFFDSSGFPPDAAQTMTMVVCELVENSLKYGRFAAGRDLITVTMRVEWPMVTVEVANPFDGSAVAHLQRLDRTIQWIRGYQDPFEAYIEKLKEVASRPLNDEESGLGIVRIAYEGRSILDFFVGDGEILRVSAVARLE